MDAGPTSSWSGCALPSKLRVERLDRDGGCDEGAIRRHSLLELTGRGGISGTVAIGDDVLEATVDDACVVTAQACQGGDGGRRISSVRLWRGDAGFEARLSRELIANHALRCGFEAEASLVPMGGCVLEGEWALTTTPRLVSGACGLPWGTSFNLSDAGLHFGAIEAVVSLDEATCSGFAQRGTADAGPWSFSGVRRETRVSFAVSGDVLTGRVEDALSAPLKGAACDGGVFDLHATRAPKRTPMAVSGACPVERPWVYADGECEPHLGENCLSPDCRCAMGTSCYDLQCVVHCGSTAQCGPSERCGPRGYCIPQGPAGVLEACETTLGCQRDLMCGRAPVTDGGVCVPPCPSGQCPSDGGWECRGFSACILPSPKGGPCRSPDDCGSNGPSGARACTNIVNGLGTCLY